MSNSVTLTFWQLLALALAPAVLTFIAGIAGPYVLEGRKQDAEKREKRRQKFEEFVSTIYEHGHWLDTQRAIMVFQQDRPSTVSPFAKMQAICSVHFPEFEQDLAELNRLSDAYMLWMTEAAQKKLNGDKGYADDFASAYKPYSGKVHSLLSKLKEYARGELQVGHWSLSTHTLSFLQRGSVWERWKVWFKRFSG